MRTLTIIKKKYDVHVNSFLSLEAVAKMNGNDIYYQKYVK